MAQGGLQPVPALMLGDCRSYWKMAGVRNRDAEDMLCNVLQWQ